MHFYNPALTVAGAPVAPVTHVFAHTYAYDPASYAPMQQHVQPASQTIVNPTQIADPHYQQQQQQFGGRPTIFAPSGPVQQIVYAAAPHQLAMPSQLQHVEQQFQQQQQPQQQPRNRVHNPYGANVVGTPTGSPLTVTAAPFTPASASPNVDFATAVPEGHSHHSHGHGGHGHHHGNHRGHAHQQHSAMHQLHAAGNGKAHFANPVSTEELLSQQGQLASLARTANGSSFIQAALRDNNELSTNLSIIWNELETSFADLLLDAHGCYVTKTVMERLQPEQLQQAVAYIAADEQLVFSLCTHSLHTRRVVQFLMDTVDCTFLIVTLVNRCAEVAMTQQGCIVMQRAMDVAAEPLRSELFAAIYANLLIFAVDPFANYVVQHMLEVGSRAANSQAILNAFSGHVLELSCNKFSSNVVEKSLVHVEPEVQHALLMEMYSVDDEILLAMLQDSFGNYLIQSSIALADYKDVFFINEKLRSVLDRTPYGYKTDRKSVV